MYGDIVDVNLEVPFLFVNEEELWCPDCYVSVNDEPTIEGEHMICIQNVYTLAFFDKQLKSLAAALLDGPSPDYPEVVFMSHHP